MIDTDPYPASGCYAGLICLTDAQIRAELTKYVTAHELPTDLTHEYFLLTPPTVVSCLTTKDSECSFNDYCAYHSHIPLGVGELIYADDPYVNGDPGCDDGQHPNGTTSDSAIEGGLSARAQRVDH